MKQLNGEYEQMRKLIGSRSSNCILLVLLLALLLIAGGCQRIKTKSQLEVLDASVRTYEKMLRWGEYREAAKYIRFREGEPDPVDFESLESIKISSMNPMKKVLSNEGKAALIQVEIQFYNEDYGVEKKLLYVENWYFDEEEKHWFIESNLPDFASAR